MTTTSANRFSKSSVGARLRKCRQVHHVKQRDIARLVGCSNGTLWHVESGEATLSSHPGKNLAKIADLCRIHPLELIAGLPKEACEIAELRRIFLRINV